MHACQLQIGINYIPRKRHPILFLTSDQHSEGKETVIAIEIMSLFTECFVKYSALHLSSQASYLNASASILWFKK